MPFADTAVKHILSGSLAVSITLAGTVGKGDALGYSTGWVLADANASPAITALLVAAEDGISGQVITAYAEAVVGGVTVGTPGAPLFLSDTAGHFTETPSTTTAQMLGVAVMATSVAINQIATRGEFVVRHSFAAADVANIFFVANRPCYVRKISAVWGTAAGQAGPLTVERLQGTEAVTQGDVLIPSTYITLNGTANTVQSPALTATAADLLLAVGNRLALRLVSGAATTLANACITVQLELA